MTTATAIDHIVNLDDPLASELGFTAERFSGWLWRRGDVIVVSMIVSLQPGQGHLSALFDAIWTRGWTVHVPTPMGLMPRILAQKGFGRTMVWDEQYQGDVEVWTR